MIANDAEILQHFIENWEKELPDFIDKLEDKVVARKVWPTRKVGEDVMIDVVVRYDRTGAGAKIMAKGSVPAGSGSVATPVYHQIFQLLDGFKIHEKDMKLDPKLKNRDVEIVLGNLNRAENYIGINGDAQHNIPGITTDIPGANQLNTLGTWAGGGSAVQYYNDIKRMRAAMKAGIRPAWLIGNDSDLVQLLSLSDDTKQPVWQQIATLFGKKATDPMDSWMMELGDETLAAGKVYMAPYDPEMGEMVISENPKMRAIAQQEGGNYPIEMYEWLTFEKHEVTAYVELDVVTE